MLNKVEGVEGAKCGTYLGIEWVWETSSRFFLFEVKSALASQGTFFFFLFSFFMLCRSQVTRQDIQWSTMHVPECLNTPEDLVTPIGLILFHRNDNFNPLRLEDGNICLGLTHGKALNLSQLCPQIFHQGSALHSHRKYPRDYIELCIGAFPDQISPSALLSPISYRDSRISENPLFNRKHNLLLDNQR